MKMNRALIDANDKVIKATTMCELPNGEKVKILIDTGADKSFINEDIAKRLKLLIKPTDHVVQGAFGDSYNAGKIENVKLLLGPEKYPIIVPELLVTKIKRAIIYGIKNMSHDGILPERNTMKGIKLKTPCFFSFGFIQTS